MPNEGIASHHLNDGSDDSLIDARIGILLRIGMLASAAVILLGGVLFLIHEGQNQFDFKVFKGVPAGLNSVQGTVTATFHGNHLAIIQFGILMLIATPIARVAFSVFAFLAQRDYLYTAISAIVLVVLLAALIWH
jgi:uncharacterized membrane protein